jgi:hypothetical protein
MNLETTSVMNEAQCPVCLKVLSTKSYLQTHLFQNKKKCVPPIGHTPPSIDYDKKEIIWSTSSTKTSNQGISKVITEKPVFQQVVEKSTPIVTKKVTNNVVKKTTPDIHTNKPNGVATKASGGVATKASGGVAKKASGGVATKASGGVAKKASGGVAKKASGGVAKKESGEVVKSGSVVKKKVGSVSKSIDVEVLDEIVRPKKMVSKKLSTDESGEVPKKKKKKVIKKNVEPDYLPALIGTVGMLDSDLTTVKTISIKPKVEIQRAPAPVKNTAIETTNTVTNNYTIAVDTNGNVVDLPHMKTDNDILKDNPLLLDQVKRVIKNLNLGGNKNGEPNYRLPPEIEKFQKLVERALEDFGDVQKIIRAGVKNPMESVDTIVSINPDEDSCIQIERIPIPEELRETTDRDLSFIEILYRGIYHLMSQIIANKFYFFENTRAKKAYDGK